MSFTYTAVGQSYSVFFEDVRVGSILFLMDGRFQYFPKFASVGWPIQATLGAVKNQLAKRFEYIKKECQEIGGTE